MERRGEERRGEERRGNLLWDDDDAHVHRLLAARVPHRLGKSVRSIVSDYDGVSKDNLELENEADEQVKIWVVFVFWGCIWWWHMCMVFFDCGIRRRDCDSRRRIAASSGPTR
jgi:hypothetical protein